jgi:hypothetical protein
MTPLRDPRFENDRIVVGLILLPLVAALLAFVSFPALYASGRALRLHGGVPTDSLDSAVAFAVWVGAIAAVMTVIGAWPAIWSLKRRGPLTMRRVLVAGALVGNTPFALIVLTVTIVRLVNGEPLTAVGRHWWGIPGAIRIIAFGTFIGVASATAFWMFVQSRSSARGTAAR